MISVSEAITLIQENIIPSKLTMVALAAGNGYILAENLFSPIDMPSFAQSAMDGYALHFDSFNSNNALPVVANIPAGMTKQPTLQAHEAMRIFTGAPIPEGADTVVIQEKVMLTGNKIVITDIALFKGANVRLQASQTAKGDLVLAKNTRLNAGIIGFLAGLGISEAKVYAKPSVGLLITGKELVSPENPLAFGQVYESNSYTLKAALSALNIPVLEKKWVNDDLQETQAAIADLLAKVEVLIITGGISVGDYDFVQPALEINGVQKLFYKVKQKPGKPFYVGKTEKNRVFALPGNPAAVHTCFYRYIQPCLLQMMGYRDAFSPTARLPLNQDFRKKAGFTHFLKAQRNENGTVDILAHQESYKMNAYVLANGYIEMAEEKNDYQKGEYVDFWSF